MKSTLPSRQKKKKKLTERDRIKYLKGGNLKNLAAPKGQNIKHGVTGVDYTLVQGGSKKVDKASYEPEGEVIENIETGPKLKPGKGLGGGKIVNPTGTKKTTGVTLPVIKAHTEPDGELVDEGLGKLIDKGITGAFNTADKVSAAMDKNPVGRVVKKGLKALVSPSRPGDGGSNRLSPTKATHGPTWQNNSYEPEGELVEGDPHRGQGEKIQKRTLKWMRDRAKDGEDVGAPGLDAIKAREDEHRKKRGVKNEGVTAALSVGAKVLPHLPKVPGAIKAVTGGLATGAGALKLKNVFKSTRRKGSAIPDAGDEFIRSSGSDREATADYETQKVGHAGASGEIPKTRKVTTYKKVNDKWTKSKPKVDHKGEAQRYKDDYNEEVELDERLGGKGYKRRKDYAGRTVEGDWPDSDRGAGNKATRRAGGKVKKKSPTYLAHVHNKEEVQVDEAKVDKGRSDYGKATIRNYRRFGPGHGEPAMFDPENKRGKAIEKRREEHKKRQGKKKAKVPAYKVEHHKKPGEEHPIDEIFGKKLTKYLGKGNIEKNVQVQPGQKDFVKSMPDPQVVRGGKTVVPGGRTVSNWRSGTSKALQMLKQSHEPQGEQIDEFLAGKPGDGYLGHPNLDIKNPFAKKQIKKPIGDTGNLGINANKVGARLGDRNFKEEGEVLEATKYSKVKGKNYKTGRKSVKGGTAKDDAVYKSVLAKIISQVGAGGVQQSSKQKKKKKGEKGRKQIGDRKFSPAETIRRRKASAKAAYAAMTDTRGT